MTWHSWKLIYLLHTINKNLIHRLYFNELYWIVVLLIVTKYIDVVLNEGNETGSHIWLCKEIIYQVFVWCVRLTFPRKSTDYNVLLSSQSAFCIINTLVSNKKKQKRMWRSGGQHVLDPTGSSSFTLSSF